MLWGNSQISVVWPRIFLPQLYKVEGSIALLESEILNIMIFLKWETNACWLLFLLLWIWLKVKNKQIMNKWTSKQINVQEERLVWLIAQSPSITQVHRGGRQRNGSELGHGTDQKTNKSELEISWIFFFPFYSVCVTSAWKPITFRVGGPFSVTPLSGNTFTDICTAAPP